MSYTNQPHKQAILKELYSPFTFPDHCMHEGKILGPQLSGESSLLKIFLLVPEVSVTQQPCTSQTKAFTTDTIFSVKTVSFPKMP
jgi:hypothetical protein